MIARSGMAKLISKCMMPTLEFLKQAAIPDYQK